MLVRNILVANNDNIVYVDFLTSEYSQNKNHHIVNKFQYPKVLFTLYSNVELPENFTPFGYKYDGINFEKVEEVTE